MLRKSLADYYAILGLQPGVSPETIKRAYRAQVRQWHPDKFTHDCRLQQTAEAKLKDINFNSPRNGSDTGQILLLH